MSEQISTAETAELLGVSVRRVRALKDRLGAVEIAGVLLFSRRKVLAFKDQPRPQGWKKGRKRTERA